MSAGMEGAREVGKGGREGVWVPDVNASSTNK
jgi:hypothetical protein